MRKTICRSSWVLAVAVGATLAPAALRAQDTTKAAAPAGPAADTPAGRTHTVRKGDTLWDLARIYLGDPFQWPQIYKLNTDLVENPHWIYPNQVLKIPGSATTLALAPISAPPAAAAPRDTAAPEAAPKDTTMRDTVVAANAAPVIALAPNNPPPETSGPTVMASPTAQPFAPAEPAAFRNVRQTLFAQREQRAAVSEQRVAVMSRATLTEVRPGEFRRAPFLWKNGGPEGAGRLIRRYDVAGIAAASNISRLQIGDGVYFDPPRGGVSVAGDLYLTIRLGEELPGRGQVVIPTGVIKVERPGVGETSRGSVTQIFETIEAGDGVIPMDTMDMARGAHPTAVDNGATGAVLWIATNPVLPSIQGLLIVSLSSRDGVKPGDQITLVRERQKDAENTMVPEQEIAAAQIVKVTEYGASAIVLSQRQPAIKVGTFVRVTARMP
jgi:LysM repeat protein